MNIDHDNHDLTSTNKSENQSFSNYDEVFTRLLTKHVNHVAPRLFALCRQYCEDAEDWVFTWGAAFDDSAALFSPNGKLVGKFISADTALNLFSRTQDLRLIWIDPTLRTQPDAIATQSHTFYQRKGNNIND
jgi:hypothetical protein